MLQGLKGRFGLRVLTGVELRLGREGVEYINACTLKLSGDLLSVIDKTDNLKNITHFSKHFKPAPIAVCLTGKGILTKEINNAVGTEHQMLQSVMPNASAEDFDFQFRSTDDHRMVSLIRRKVAEEIVAELSDLGFQVIALSLSELSDNSAYDAALQVLLGEEIIEVKQEEFANNRLQMFAKVRVTSVGLVFGLSLFVLLVCNFLLNGYFDGQANQLALKRTATGMEIKKFQEMETDVVQKATFIRNTGWTGGYPLAWLTDQLLIGKPNTITLQNLLINPLKPIKIQGAAATEAYMTNTIIVSGLCDEAATLNNWLFEIRSRGFVAGCTVDRYVLNKESGKASFTIQILVKDYEG